MESCSHYGCVDKTIYSRQGQCLRETIAELRRQAGLTQRQLAARLHREHNLVGRLELGERRLDVVEFYWVCKACGASPEAVAARLMRDFEEIQKKRGPQGRTSGPYLAADRSEGNTSDLQ